MQLAEYCGISCLVSLSVAVLACVFRIDSPIPFQFPFVYDVGQSIFINFELNLEKRIVYCSGEVMRFQILLYHVHNLLFIDAFSFKNAIVKSRSLHLMVMAFNRFLVQCFRLFFLLLKFKSYFRSLPLTRFASFRFFFFNFFVSLVVPIRQDDLCRGISSAQPF